MKINSLFKYYLKFGIIAFIFTVLVLAQSIFSANTRLDAQIEAYLNPDNQQDHIVAASYYTNENNIEIPDIESDFFWTVSNINNSIGSFMIIAITALAVLFYRTDRSKSTGAFISQLPVTSGKRYIYKLFTGYSFIIIFFIIAPLLIYLGVKNNYHECSQLYLNYYSPDTPAMAFMKSYTDTFINIYLINFVRTLLLFSLFNMIQTLCGRAEVSIIALFLLALAILGGIMGLQRFLETFNLIPPYTYISSYYSSVTDFLLKYYIGIPLSILLSVIGYFSYTHSNNARNGKIFLYKPLEYIAYLIGCVLGAFCFFELLVMFDLTIGISLFTGTIILISGAVISLIIMRKIVLLYE